MGATPSEHVVSHRPPVVPGAIRQPSHSEDRPSDGAAGRIGKFV